MQCAIIKTDEVSIEPFRKLFLAAFNNQFVYDKCHYYGWAGNYLFIVNGTEVGYGSIWGTNDRSVPDSIFECYILPPYRKYVDEFFSQLISLTQASFIECQTNDIFLYELLCRFSDSVKTERILFKEHIETNLQIPGTVLRKRTENDTLNSDDGDHILEHNGSMVAHGGLLLNYNFPYADIYMHVLDDYRHKGFGSLIAQELKKAAYSMQRVPAARCNINNTFSKRTLEKAGFLPCGFIQTGTIKTSRNE